MSEGKTRGNNFDRIVLNILVLQNLIIILLHHCTAAAAIYRVIISRYIIPGVYVNIDIIKIN